MFAVANRIDAPKPITERITEKLIERIYQRVGNRTDQIAIRELRQMGIVASRGLLRGLLPGGPITNFLIDFGVQEVARNFTQKNVSDTLLKFWDSDINVQVTGFGEELARIEQLEGNVAKRAIKAALDKGINALKDKYSPSIANELRRILPDDLANATVTELREIVTTSNVIRTAVEAQDLDGFLYQLENNIEFGNKFARQQTKRAKRFAADTFLRNVRRKFGRAVSDGVSEAFPNMSRKNANQIGTELVAGIRRSTFNTLSRVLGPEIDEIKDYLVDELNTVASQVEDAIGGEGGQRPWESKEDYRERLKARYEKLQDISRSEQKRSATIDGVPNGVSPRKVVAKRSESADFPIRRPLSEFGSTDRVLVTPAPKIAGALPSGTLPNPRRMKYKELQAEIQQWRDRGVRTPWIGADKATLRDAVQRLRYGQYPSKRTQRFPKTLIPDPTGMTRAQLQVQAQELWQAGFKIGDGEWWKSRIKMRNGIRKIRNAQIEQSFPILRKRGLQGRSKRLRTKRLRSSRVVFIQPPQRALPERAGPSGIVRPIRNPKAMGRKELIETLKNLRDQGYQVPRLNSNTETLLNAVERFKRDKAVLSNWTPSVTKVWKRPPGNELPDAQRWQRMLGEPDSDYIARLRGLIAHRTGETPLRAELWNDKKWIGELSKQYRALQDSLRTPMRGIKALPDDAGWVMPERNQRWKRIAGEKIDPYTNRLNDIFRNRKGFRLQQLPEETKTQFMERLRSRVRDIQELPPRGGPQFSMPSSVPGSRKRYVYVEGVDRYLDTRTGQYRGSGPGSRFIWDKGVGQYRDLATGKIISARKIRAIIRQHADASGEIFAQLNRALVQSDNFGPERFRSKASTRMTGTINNFGEAFKLPPARKELDLKFTDPVPTSFRNISLPEWQRKFTREMKNYQAQQYTLGAGGMDIVLANESTALADLNAMMDKQLGFFDRFVDTIIDGALTAAEFYARAMLYKKVGEAAFWLGDKLKNKILGRSEKRRVLGQSEHCSDCIVYASRGWVDIDDDSLPPPKQNSLCGGNCYCRMEYR